MKKKQFLRLASSVVIAFMLAILIPKSQAAILTTASDFLTRQKGNLVSGETHEIQFTPVTAVTGEAGTNKVIAVFPDGDDGTWCYAAGTDLVTSVSGLKADSEGNSVTALPGSSLTAKCVQGSGASSFDTITVEGVNALSAGTTYAVIVSDGSTGKLGTPANNTTGFMNIKTNDGHADIDTKPITVDILTTDQISVSAHVEPTLTFAITDTAIGFGSIPLASVRYATDDETEAGGQNSEPDPSDPTQLQLSTNAQDGAVIEIKDTNLNSASGLYDVASTTTLAATDSYGILTTGAGTEGFGVYGKDNSADIGTLTIAETFDNDDTGGAAISTTLQTFASSTGPLDGAVVDVSAVATISSVTPTGTYADTLTVVATGKF
mgnify:FL=1